MTWLQLYLWTRADDIHNGLLAVAGILACTIVVSAMVTGMDVNEDPNFNVRARQWRKVMYWIVSISAVLAVLMPTRDDLAMMAGVHWASNNTNVQAIPDEALRLVREWIDVARPVRDTTKGRGR